MTGCYYASYNKLHLEMNSSNELSEKVDMRRWNNKVKN